MMFSMPYEQYMIDQDIEDALNQSQANPTPQEGADF
jgi:hypothetical protein